MPNHEVSRTFFDRYQRIAQCARHTGTVGGR